MTKSFLIKLQKTNLLAVQYYVLFFLALILFNKAGHSLVIFFCCNILFYKCTRVNETGPGRWNFKITMGIRIHNLYGTAGAWKPNVFGTLMVQICWVLNLQYLSRLTQIFVYSQVFYLCKVARDRWAFVADSITLCGKSRNGIRQTYSLSKWIHKLRL